MSDRRSGRLRRAEVDREKTQATLSARAQQLATGFGKEKERFASEMQSAEAQRGTGGEGAEAAPLASHTGNLRDFRDVQPNCVFELRQLLHY